jgi:hypothetical protein
MIVIVVVLVTMVMSARCGINNNGAKREREGVYWRERLIETIDRMRLMCLYKMQCVGKGEKNKVEIFFVWQVWMRFGGYRGVYLV